MTTKKPHNDISADTCISKICIAEKLRSIAQTLLAQGMLKGADLTAFVERSVEVL